MSADPATLAEWEARADLTPAEKALIGAARAGRRCVLGKRPEADSEDRRIRASLIRLIAIGGTEACGLPGTGLWLEGAWITETPDLRHATARGEIVLDFCTLVEEPRLDYARLTMLSLEDSALPGLFAQGADCRGSLFLSRAKVTGTIDVNAATIGGQLACAGATLDGNGGEALNAQGVNLGNSLFLRNAMITGTVDVNSASIGGQLTCDGATMDGKDGKALHAQKVRLGEYLFLSGATVTGTVDLAAATIGGLACDGATLNGNGGRALHAQRLLVEHSFFFRGVKAVRGDVSLSAAHVGDLVDDPASWDTITGRTYLDGFTYGRVVASSTDARTRLNWLEKCAEADGVVFPQPYTQLAKVLAGMGHARAARLVLHRRGQRMAAQEHRRDRERLAALRVESGRLDGAEAIEAARRGDRLWWRMVFTQLWTLFLDRLIGYGHRPEFAALWALGTVLLAALVYVIAYRNGGMVPDSEVVMISASWASAMVQNPDAPALIWATMPEGLHYQTFAALPYALDVVLPIVDLGQQAAWAPSTQGWPGSVAWVATWVFTLAGWMLSALLVAALTGLIQRGQPGADQ